MARRSKRSAKRKRTLQQRKRESDRLALQQCKQERDELADVEAVECCEKGICPRCGGHLEDIGVVRVEDFVIEEDYGEGFYAVRSPP